MRKIEQTDAKQTNRILRNLLNQDEPKQDYPKILLVGAVTIEETTGGHILLYRLFKEYPADKLMVIGSRRSRNPKFPPARLPDVSYEIREEADFFYYRLRRQLSPRYRSIGRWYYELLFRAQLWLYEREIMPLIRAYQPDLILSFTMSFHWYAAYRIVQKSQLPLALILHDRWEPSLGPYAAQSLCSEFEAAYKFAQHRFCISPTMERLYFQQTGIRGDILYPIGDDAPPDTRPTMKQSCKDKKNLTVVFFGNIWQDQPMIVDFAHKLAARKIELVLFSNRELEHFIELGLQTPNVQANSFIPNHDDLLAWCKENADILYLPISFDKDDEFMVQYSFQSKLVDYLSLALPILIHAPPTSSVIEFAKQYHDSPFAEIVTSSETNALEPAITALLDSEYRKWLCENSLRVWQNCFKGDVVRRSFFDKLLS